MIENPSGWAVAIKALFQAVRGESLAAATAGIAGAITIAMVEWKGFVMLLRQVIIGGIFATYAGPLAVPILSFVLGIAGLDRDHGASLGPYMSGIFAIMIVEYGIAAFRARKRYLEVEQRQRRSTDMGIEQEPQGDITDVDIEYEGDGRD